MKTRLIALIAALVMTAGLHAQQNSAPKQQDPELQTRMQNLIARGVAAIETLDTLNRRLKRQGLTLRHDVVAQRVRLESAMDEAEAAMKDNRDKDAKRAIMRGEGAVARIEAFLEGK